MASGNENVITLRPMSANDAEREVVKLAQALTERAHELGIHCAVVVKVSDGAVSDAYGSAEGLAAGIAALTDHIAGRAGIETADLRRAIGAYHALIDDSKRAVPIKPS